MNKLSQKELLVATVVVAILCIGFLPGFIWKKSSETSTTKLRRGEIAYEKTNTAGDEQNVQELRIYDTWVHYTTEEGLPSNKVNCVKADGDRIWIGTDKGLALMEGGVITKVYGEADGLSYRNVVSIDVSPMTGDVWIGTMSGLSRLSAGKFEQFNQFNSGMPNDVVYQVFCIDKYVWMATGGGAGCYDTYTREWKIFTEMNAPMHEPWTYGVSGGDGKVYIAAWGGGIIEYELGTGKMRDYVDPDGEMEIDLFPDDGPVHDITTGSSYDKGILWIGTYFGMSRYDGTHWKGYFDHDSGLASNFINFTKAHGTAVWLCTDNGLSNFNGEVWVTYRPIPDSKQGSVIVTEGKKERTLKTSSSLSNNFVWGMDIQDHILWIATAKGLSRGEASGKLIARAVE